MASGQPTLAATHITADGKYILEMPGRWIKGEAEDSDTLLSLSAGNASLSITKLDEKADAEQLMSQLQHELMVLRSKGYAVPGRTVQTTNHMGARLIYAIYHNGAEQFTGGFLIIGQKAFVLSAVNLREDELLASMQTLRRKGEPLAAQKKYSSFRTPRTPPAVAPSQAPISTETLVSLMSGTISSSTLAAYAETAPHSQEPLAPDQQEPTRPLLPRGPLPLYIFVGAALLWGAGAAYTYKHAERMKPSKDDTDAPEITTGYNFPYNVAGKLEKSKLLFFFSGRDALVFRAEFNCLPEKIVAFSVYALLAFEFTWSCLEIVGLDMQALLAHLPGGALLASFPEFLFLAALGTGLVLRYSDDRPMDVKDKEGTVLFRTTGNSAVASVTTAHGTELGKITRSSESTWAFYNTDGSRSFELIEKDRKKKNLRRIFGSMGGLLDARYEFYVKGQPAGNAVPTQKRPLACKVDFSYNFYTSVNKEAVMATLLYIKAIEHDCLYPWLN